MSDLSAEKVVAELRALADCDTRSGEPLGKCMRQAADLIADQAARIAAQDDELIGERWHADEAARQRDVAKAALTAAEAALIAIRRRAIFGPSIAISDLLDLTKNVAGQSVDASLCPHAPTYDAGLCCGHPDDCTFVSPAALSEKEQGA